MQIKQNWIKNNILLIRTNLRYKANKHESQCFLENNNIITKHYIVELRLSRFITFIIFFYILDATFHFILQYCCRSYVKETTNMTYNGRLYRVHVTEWTVVQWTFEPRWFDMDQQHVDNGI